MRIAVFGTGGAGGYFGARLALAGEEVAFIARGAHLEAIRRDGLVLDTPEGELAVAPARATDRPAEVGPVDVVLLGVKAWQVREAAAAMTPLLGPGTVVVPLQNGVEAADELAAVLGSGPVLGGLCRTFSWVTAPGRIRNIGPFNAILVGERDNRASARTARLRDTLLRAGLGAEIPPDIAVAVWEKFLLVTTFGAIGALARAPIGVLRALPESRSLLERCAAEALAVGRARGVALPADAVASALAMLDRLAPASTTSLQRDLAEGRPSELEAWSGAVVRLGRAAGVPTPLHETVYHAMLPGERRARGALTYPA
ncbi:MAG: 2-dehydropantoate 2-reductase [Dongiaceae bacterium]